jgi:hypothetical protein
MKIRLGNKLLLPFVVGLSFGFCTHITAQVSAPKRTPLTRVNLVSAPKGQLSVNQLKLLLNNVGTLESSTQRQSAWTGWKLYDVYQYPPVWQHGLTILGKRNGQVGCLPCQWQSPYSPGPIIGGEPASRVRPQDSYRYRVYDVVRGETSDMNPDLLEWPTELGAPTTADGKPDMKGDQLTWAVYNGIDTTKYPGSFKRNGSMRAVLPLEIHQSAFEHFGELNDTTVWANVSFYEWKLFNRSGDLLDSVYVSLFTDLDFLDDFDNIPGVDTASQTGYCWFARDSSYASFGYCLLNGPTIPSPGDTAVAFGKSKPGFRNLPLSTFWGIRDDSYPDSSQNGPPYSTGTAWNVVRGLAQNGSSLIDPISGQPTRFPYSGDPMSGQGYVCPWRSTGGGAGFMMTTGPFTIAPGDSQWLMMALIPSVRMNGVDAINRMRTAALYLRSLPYDSLVTPKARRIVPIGPLPGFGIPSAFALFPNYPNPFNAATEIPFDLPEMSMVKVEVFDLLGRRVALLADQMLERGHRLVRWEPTQATGVYLFRVVAQSVESNKEWSGQGRLLLVR